VFNPAPGLLPPFFSPAFFLSICLKRLCVNEEKNCESCNRASHVSNNVRDNVSLRNSLARPDASRSNA